MSSVGIGVAGSLTTRGRPRWELLTGIAFVVLFVGSVVGSNALADGASDKAWVANYTGRTNQAQHLATGILLLLAALCLLSFLTSMWTRIAEARRPAIVNPLPLVAAGVSAACIAVGGILMAGISGSLLIGPMPMPGADVLRLTNDLGFAMVGVAGMSAAALSIACLSVQARAAGLFGRRLLIFSLVVALALLGSIAFLPIITLLIWLVVVGIALSRSPGATG